MIHVQTLTEYLDDRLPTDLHLVCIRCGAELFPDSVCDGDLRLREPLDVELPTDVEWGENRCYPHQDPDLIHSPFIAL